MNVSDRDRKIIIVVVPLVILLGYWFLLLAPKREQASAAATKLAKQEMRLDAARSVDAGLGSAKTDYAADYSELVRLGKAVPTSVDMPSLIVQLESAAQGTGIRFARIATGQRAPAVAAGSGAAPPAPGSGNGSQPAAAGGAPAQSGTGKAAENAGNAVQDTNDSSAAAAQSGVAPTDAQTSKSSGKGVPVGGGSAPGSEQAPATGGSGAPGLDTVPLELEFQGGFFDLADFFHRLKRFVRLTNGQIDVRGRLVSIDGLKFSSDPEIFPRLKAEITATAYLAPKAEGETAGATPTGPASPQPTPTSGGSSTPIAPAATATP